MRQRLHERTATLCALCREQQAKSIWTYVYGRPRRGMSPRTGEVDYRPLGTDEVAVCRRCEWRAVAGNLRESLARHPVRGGSAALSFVSFVAAAGAFAPALLDGRWVAFAGAAFMLAFVWSTRRPGPMCLGVFLLRRDALAAAHGLSPADLEPYLDVRPESVRERGA